MIRNAFSLINQYLKKFLLIKSEVKRHNHRIQSRIFPSLIINLKNCSKIIKNKLRMKHLGMLHLKDTNRAGLAIKKCGGAVRTPAVSATRVLSSYVLSLAQKKDKSEREIDGDKPSTDGNNNLGKNSIMRLTKRQLHLKVFLQLMDTKLMKNFLGHDKCFLMSDNYLLAMSFVYSEKAQLSLTQFCEAQFFQCLYLACIVEEDDCDLKDEVFPWLFGKANCKTFRLQFLRSVRKIMKALNYQLIVTPDECLDVMHSSNHHIWSRVRTPKHDTGVREYKKKYAMRDMKGPYSDKPLFCYVCDVIESKAPDQITVVTPCNGTSVAGNFNSSKGNDSGIVCDTSAMSQLEHTTDSDFEFKGTILDF